MIAQPSIMVVLLSASRAKPSAAQWLAPQAVLGTHIARRQRSCPMRRTGSTSLGIAFTVRGASFPRHAVAPSWAAARSSASVVARGAGPLRGDEAMSILNEFKEFALRG